MSRLLDGGYTQMFIVAKGSGGLTREVLFRCGNFIYAGRAEVFDRGSAEAAAAGAGAPCPPLTLEGIPPLARRLHAQQGALPYLCPAAERAEGSEWEEAFGRLQDTLDYLGEELSGERTETAVEAAVRTYGWVNAEGARVHFELMTRGLPELAEVDVALARCCCRGVLLTLILVGDSFFATVADAEEAERPLVDAVFPDVSGHLQGAELRRFRDPHLVKLLRWQTLPQGSATAAVAGAAAGQCARPEEGAPAAPAAGGSEADSGSGSAPATALEAEELAAEREAGARVAVARSDTGGLGYAQAYCVLQPEAGAVFGERTSRRVFLRVGEACYEGRAEMAPTVDVGDVRGFVRQLTELRDELPYACEARAVPATSPFAAAMARFASMLLVAQGEMVGAEHALLLLGERLAAMGRADEAKGWLDGEGGASTYFEFATEDAACFADVELIAAKVYRSALVLTAVYHRGSLYVGVADGERSHDAGVGHALLDPSFPDIGGSKARGYQIAAYPEGVPGFGELRRLCMWQTGFAEDCFDEFIAARRAEGKAPDPPRQPREKK